VVRPPVTSFAAPRLSVLIGRRRAVIPCNHPSACSKGGLLETRNLGKATRDWLESPGELPFWGISGPCYPGALALSQRTTKPVRRLIHVC